jgi:cell fate regulator YaaT (PSP1 superfamily)
MDMAYEQNLGSMGANRVTGACGKLMCCLKYEQDCYSECKKKMPQVGSEVKTKEGEGVVISQNMVKNIIVVELKDDKRRVEVSC